MLEYVPDSFRNVPECAGFVPDCAGFDISVPDSVWNVPDWRCAGCDIRQARTLGALVFRVAPSGTRPRPVRVEMLNLLFPDSFRNVLDSLRMCRFRSGTSRTNTAQFGTNPEIRE